MRQAVTAHLSGPDYLLFLTWFVLGLLAGDNIRDTIVDAIEENTAACVAR